MSMRAKPMALLLIPVKRDSSKQLGQDNALRLPPIEDRLDHVRGEAGERQEPADVSVRHAFLGSEVGDRPRLPVFDPPAPAVRLYQCPEHRLVSVWLRRRRRGPVGCDDQLAAAAALEAHGDAGHNNVELDVRPGLRTPTTLGGSHMSICVARSAALAAAVARVASLSADGRGDGLRLESYPPSEPPNLGGGFSRARPAIPGEPKDAFCVFAPT